MWQWRAHFFVAPSKPKGIKGKRLEKMVIRTKYLLCCLYAFFSFRLQFELDMVNYKWETLQKDPVLNEVATTVKS